MAKDEEWVEKMVARLEQDGWPKESIENFRSFRSGSSLLFPFVERNLQQPIRKEVQTPRGRGRLLMLLDGYAYVLLNSPAQEKPYTYKRRRYPAMTPIPYKEVRPA